MSRHFVCDRCGGPAHWDLFAGVPYVRLHAAVPERPDVVYDHQVDLCRPCFELVAEMVAPNKWYGETKKGD